MSTVWASKATRQLLSGLLVWEGGVDTYLPGCIMTSLNADHLGFKLKKMKGQFNTDRITFNVPEDISQHELDSSQSFFGNFLS